MINRPSLLKGLNIRIPSITPIKEGGLLVMGLHKGLQLIGPLWPLSLGALKKKWV